MPDIAQLLQALSAHSQRNAPCGAKQIGQRRRAVAGRVFKQKRRPFGAQHAVAESRHLEPGRDRLLDAFQRTKALEPDDELTQISIFHTKKLF